VIPAAETPAYSEQVVFLPGAFFPVDGLRPMSHTPSRSQLQLPEEGFLFCCFNAPFKITPQVFDSWLALLADVRGSLLWLRRGDPTAANNLLARAQAYGIAPERLVFAPRIAAAADYLASYRIADLFLDTFPYGAHSTAADALYAGLPVLTRAAHDGSSGAGDADARGIPRARAGAGAQPGATLQSARASRRIPQDLEAL